jgi:hypothetical protein
LKELKGEQKMPKAKSKATVMTADGSGGLAEVQDRRFEQGDWPIRFEVPNEQAGTWLRYFSAECERRGWNSSSFGQMEARENSGSITVNTGGAAQRSLAVVWERKRDRPMSVRARSAGVSEFPVAEAQEFFERVNDRCRSGATERVYRRGLLEYDGLPWCGELWLDDTLRLGPPSRQDETALLGPRVIVVDALVDCVGRSDSIWVFDKNLRELSVFLSVVMGTGVRVPQDGRIWTRTSTGALVDCAVRDIGYWEQDNPNEIPERNAGQAMPLRAVARPDFSLRGIDITTTEMALPADAPDLWAAYRALTEHSRQQFLQAGSKWQEALVRARDRETLSFALMVVACESLKPEGQQFQEHNIYDVVEGLLGKSTAEPLKVDWFRPQNVRSVHLHRGEFLSSEFVQVEIMSSYHDPTFDQARRALAQITQEAIIEWLRRRGVFTMAPVERKKTFRRWIRENALVILPALTVLGVALGWFLRTLSYR